MEAVDCNQMTARQLNFFQLNLRSAIIMMIIIIIIIITIIVHFTPGSPLCSCTRIKSVTSLARQA